MICATGDDVIAVILAGGEGRRMKKTQVMLKALILLGSKPLISYIINNLQQQVKYKAILSVARQEPMLQQFVQLQQFDLPIVSDDDFVGCGPLAGILAAMKWVVFNYPAARWLISVPSDTPFIPDDLVEKLRSAVCDDSQIITAASPDRPHWTISLWSLSLISDIENTLIAGDYSLGKFIRSHIAKQVIWPDPLVFLNINDASDLLAAEKLL